MTRTRHAPGTLTRLCPVSVGLLFLCAGVAHGATADVADAAMRGNRDAVRAAVTRKADVNAPQVDGTTALHWAVQRDDVEMADLLIAAGARVAARTREGVMPLQLAAINGSAPMIERLLKAGADPNAALTPRGDTALMFAARTGKTEPIRVLVGAGANVNATESWGGTTPLMWAVSEGHSDAARLLVELGADINARSHYVAAANGRGFEGRTPVAGRTDPKTEEFASGWLSPLALAAREGNVETVRILVNAGADVDAISGDGKTPLALAIFNGNYDVASFLVDSKADVNKADAQRFTPLFWAVDRRNMETAPNFPWMVTADPMPLIHKLLDAGANPNALVNNTPRARMREGSPRIVFATALMRAAFAADLELVKLLLERGADPKILSKDSETMLESAAGLAFIHGYHRGKSPEERLQVVKLFVDLGNHVNHHDDYGITPLMAAGNFGNVPIIQYLHRRRGRPRRARPRQEERRTVRLQQRAADADRLRHRRRNIRAEQRRHHPRGSRGLDGHGHEGARHRAHHLGVHAARLHLLAGQSGSQGCDPGRDHPRAQVRDRPSGRGAHRRPRSEVRSSVNLSPPHRLNADYLLRAVLRLA